MTDRTKSPRQRDLKLELTWVGKDHRPRIEPRILLEDPERHYHAAGRVTDHDEFENKLIFGDNLLALKALATDDTVKGKVKCIFIDPPYNTGSAFEHYDDGMEHSLWLSMMRERLELLRELLSDDGSIWISIDDNEVHYLKVLCDEIFGRRNFVSNIVWEKVYTPKNNGRVVSSDHDHLLVYAAHDKFFEIGWNFIPRNEEQIGRFRNPDNDPNGPWRTYPLDVRTESGQKREKYRYEVVTPSGRIVKPSAGRHWVLPEEKFRQEQADGNIYFGVDGSAMPSRKVYLKDANQGVIARTWWPYKEVGGNQDAKREILALFGDSGFITPKPERLIQQVLTIATNTGDLVLDSFAGSGTTGAVAHKMGRKWIMVELGEHAHTHIIPRMQKVIDGTDQGGISQAVGWQGGGGFRYYKLAPSLIKKDKRGNEVINPEYNPEMLSEASCKLKGFTFAPSESRELWWQQGRSSERDFLYVTTQYMDYAALQDLSEEVGADRTLLVLCKAFDRAGDTLPNLTIEKIPDSVLHLAEWDHDDYSLKVENLPKAEPKPEPALAGAAKTGRKSKAQMAGAAGLFDEPVTDAGGDS